MSIDTRIGIAGLAMALVGVALPVLWPDEKWIGWICLSLAGVLAVWWFTLEVRNRNVGLWASVLFGMIVGAGIGALIWSSSSKASAPTAATKPQLMATYSAAEYPQGSTIAGIPWSSRFTDLRISLFNSDSIDWEDLDVNLRPDVPVATMSQTTSVPDTSSSPAATTNQAFRMEFVEGATGKRTAVPLVLIASTAGYRMQCKRLSRKTRIELALATVAIPEYSNGPPKNPKPDLGVFDRDYAVRIKNDLGSNWYGHGSDSQGRIEEVYSLQRPVPKTVQIDGRYKVNGEERVFSQELQVRDVIGDAIPMIQKNIKEGK